MNTLDFGAIRERDPYWFENYALFCPFCDGTGRRPVYIRGAVRSHEWFDECVEEREEECEHCDGEMFDVMWDTAFSVRVPYPGQSSEDQYGKYRRIAWEEGFCLIRHSGEHYLLMGGCGSDYTWKIHWTRYRIQGWLDREDYDDCLNSGGYVFLAARERKKLCRYFRDMLPDPEQYAVRLKEDKAKWNRIARGV